MRHVLIAAGALAIAAQAYAQTAAAPPAESATPPLTKTVAVDPNDSPMVRAAKKAVASRVHPTQRRVVSLSTANARGHFAVSTGPVEGPKVLPLATTSTQTAPKPQPSLAQQEAARRAAVQEKLKKLETEENQLGAEMDEPYGHDLDEDEVEKRLIEIQAEKKKLQKAMQSPPP